MVIPDAEAEDTEADVEDERETEENEVGVAEEPEEMPWAAESGKRRSKRGSMEEKKDGR